MEDPILNPLVLSTLTAVLSLACEGECHDVGAVHHYLFTHLAPVPHVRTHTLVHGDSVGHV